MRIKFGLMEAPEGWAPPEEAIEAIAKVRA